MHKADRESALTKATIQTIMSEEKANQKARLKIPMDRIRKYFPQSYTAAQIEEIIKKIEVLGGKVELTMKKLAE